MEENTNLLNINSAAQMLGVSKVTLRKWDFEGKLKPIRIGTRGDRRYKLEELQQFLQNTPAYSPINQTEFEKWMREPVWREEAPGLLLTLEDGCQQMVEFGSWISPGISNYVFMYENDFFYQAMSIEESLAHCRGHFELLHKHPEKLQAVLKEWDDAMHNLELTLKRLEFVQLDQLSIDALHAEFQTLSNAFNRFWKVTLITEPWGPYLDDEYLPQFQKILNNHPSAKEAFAVLTLPDQSSFISEEHKDTLRLAIKFLSNPLERKKLIEMKNEDYLAYISIERLEFFDALQKHQQKFYWMQNSYSEWTILSVQDFLGFLRDMIKTKNATELKLELEKLEKQPEAQLQRRKWLSELSLSSKVLNELEYIRKISWLKDERKRGAVMSLHHIFRFTQEVGRRLNIESKLVGYVQGFELKELLEGKISVEILKQRRQRVVHAVQTGNKRAILTGNDALNVKKHLFEVPELKEGAGIGGNVACRGSDAIVTGKVRIIMNPKGQHMEPDEILVSSMTRPDFLQLMKQARAIITDEGGITCHAAIVSREMNKPCIIGTMHATKALCSGDIIEMRMNHGLINIKKQG